MKGNMLVVLGVLGLGGVAAYFLLRKKVSSPSVVVPEQPNKTPPIPGGNTGISVLVQPIVDLKQAGFRAVQQTYMPSALTSQELWGGAKVAVEGELNKANQKLPVNKPLTYAAYRDAKGQVFLRVMQRGTQNETWYQEATVYGGYAPPPTGARPPLPVSPPARPPTRPPQPLTPVTYVPPPAGQVDTTYGGKTPRIFTGTKGLGYGWLFGPRQNVAPVAENLSMTTLPVFNRSGASAEKEVVKILEGIGKTTGNQYTYRVYTDAKGKKDVYLLRIYALGADVPSWDDANTWYVVFRPMMY